VWQVIWSVRPRLRAIANLPLSAPEPAILTFWAKRVGTGMALIPLKLLHLLLVGYQPEQHRPVVRWASASRRKT
jgi:hypothetical protein